MAKQIPLTRGKVAIVDDEDYERLMQYKWCCSASGYALRGYKENGRMKYVWMHREIAGNPKGRQVDHINGNRRDNRKCNLRVVTVQENAFNTKSKHVGSSHYKGVGWCSQKSKWRARIMLAGKETHIGFFQSEHQAAQAYNKKAIELFGEYAKLNEIKEEKQLCQ